MNGSKNQILELVDLLATMTGDCQFDLSYCRKYHYLCGDDSFTITQTHEKTYLCHD